MFNKRTVVEGSTTYNIDVVQQPNDAADSARLYGELRDKAFKEVLDTTINRLGAINVISRLVVCNEIDMSREVLIVHVAFKLNDETVEFECEESKMSEKVMKAVSSHIMIKVMNILMKKCNVK